MVEELITFETAKLAKEKGFTMFENNFKSALIDSRNYDVQRYSFYRVIKDEQILNLNVGTNSSNINGLWESYKDENFVTQENYFAPTQSLLQKWLREKHNIYVDSYHDLTADGKGIQYYTSWGFIQSKDINGNKNVNGWYDEYNNWKTYEEALEFGLQEGLKLIEIVKEK